MGKEKESIRTIYLSLCKHCGKKDRKLSDIEMLAEISSMQQSVIKEISALKKEKKRDDQRISSFLEVITSLAHLDYSKRAEISGEGDHMDALALGLNMMGEEMYQSTVSLSEKEILLKEIHHRVKNNLQLVCSLLNIQSSYISDPDALIRFKETQNRVNSMSLIHEKLYVSKDFSRINFGEYLDSIANYLSAVYNVDPERIQVINQISKDSGMLILDTALPCGLIMNELLSNALKYAFPEGKKGQVILGMECKSKSGKKQYTLNISDNGKGLPKGLIPEQTESLGMQLVTTLVDQIDGKMELVTKPGKGTTFKIRFEQ